LAPCARHLAALLARGLAVPLPKAISRHERCQTQLTTTDGNRNVLSLAPCARHLAALLARGLAVPLPKAISR
ncbi:hypothetical protein VR684_24460, partial [Escherichia coli]|uniref:hypothetical protein n=1 Tax=Escherichia coli TaxID=562 RepID=UPI001C68DAB4